MCVGPLAPKTPPMPPVPEPPAPLPPPPQAQDPAIVRARTRSRQQAALAEGRGSTVLTSGLGLTTPASSTKKTLLGS